MKKALFLDRDGTLIVEPAIDFQVDSLEKLEFLPGAISAMRAIAGLGFELVLATNQDGLGTESFPEDTFWPAQDRMLKTLENEGVRFDDILIDRTFEADGAPTRKPGTAMFGKYLTGEYDLVNSFVIGDRITDVQLARNLGAKAILIRHVDVPNGPVDEAGLRETTALESGDWGEIAEFLRLGQRTASVERRTRETAISLELDLDGRGKSHIHTGLGFFDHMLQQIVCHGGVSLHLNVEGDLHVDEHHTVEDVAIVLGEAFDRALGSKLGIERYGFALPMDDCAAAVLIDFGGRVDCRWRVRLRRERIGDMPAEMFEHFFRSFAQGARCNLHIRAKGSNEHHKAEAIFKAFARAVRMAVRRDPAGRNLPSSKGLL
ncbi:MAG: bifunctional histidinol-phosphatase/imidazoleglycerol-phosphate dehydratase HisB [Rikenellaceae bacterium]|jgi:imidazoleglycerol-phosphate dehydratase/histidinol-phosphatase|nr:bifunctional histidinol-phosphatase/imidazoleglycerol-phosphate dehydratase HisB [Rikenellaceae bacterium]